MALLKDRLLGWWRDLAVKEPLTAAATLGAVSVFPNAMIHLVIGVESMMTPIINLISFVVVTFASWFSFRRLRRLIEAANKEEE